MTEEEADNESMTHQGLTEHLDEEQCNECIEEPLVFACTEDDVYIVFETSTKDIQRGQQSFNMHNATVPKKTTYSIHGKPKHLVIFNNNIFPCYSVHTVYNIFLNTSAY